MSRILYVCILNPKLREQIFLDLRMNVISNPNFQSDDPYMVRQTECDARYRSSCIHKKSLPKGHCR